MPGSPFDRSHWDFAPWSFWADATADEQDEQRALQHEFVEQFPGSSIAERCFVSTLAAVQTDVLVLGPGSYIAANAYVTGSVRAGRDCTVNPFAVVRGDITLGDAVRIGAHTSILGFNHTMSDPGVDVFRQPLTSTGIRIGDDVWIGSNAVVLDGVTVGSRSVIAAGAIVTKDVPAGAVVAGSPAVIKRWRVAPIDALGDRLAAWEATLRDELPGILERSWRPELGTYVNGPGASPTVRAQCDAIELATTVTGVAPAQLSRDDHVSRLAALQDPRTGLVAEFSSDGHLAPKPEGVHDGSANYHVLAVGYALDVLGAEFPHPITAVGALEPAELVDTLTDPRWRGREWSFGAWVDAIGTAVHWNRRAAVEGRPGTLETLLGWLSTHADPATGMWGAASADGDRLEIVNGFYRATRGSFAQFGMPVAHPERVIDTVLEHAADPRHFRPELLNACNVLDVIHPLWLVGRQTPHRRDEVVELARVLLGQALDLWAPSEGFGFAAPAADGSRSGESVPGLQGTEMWTAIVWYLAEVAGLGDRIALRPKGVHRPEAPGAL